MFLKFDIKKIIENYDIIEVISLFIKLKQSGLGFFANCPFHEEKTASFYVNKNKQKFYCFGCQKHGDIITFLMLFKKINFLDALTYIIKKEKIGTPVNLKNNNNNLFYKLNKNLIKEFFKKKYIYDFLSSRGISYESIIKFKLGYINDKFTTNKEILKQLYQNKKVITFKFFNRILFPITNLNGEIIALAGRSLSNKIKPKYINSLDSDFFSKKKTLYGLYDAIKTKKHLDYIIIVEGYIDVIRLSQNGITNVVALMGTSVSKEHLILLKMLYKKIIFCFDGDLAGKLASLRAAYICIPLIFDFKSIRFIIMPKNKDPDSLLKESNKNCFIKLINKSIFIIDFIFLSLKIKINDFYFFFKLNSLLKNISNNLIKKFILMYLNHTIDNKSYITIENNNILSLSIKACFFLIKSRKLINKINFCKEILKIKNFKRKDFMTFIDLFFLLKKNSNLKLNEINKRLVNKLKIKNENYLILLNKMSHYDIELEFSNIIEKFK